MISWALVKLVLVLIGGAFAVGYLAYQYLQQHRLEKSIEEERKKLKGDDFIG